MCFCNIFLSLCVHVAVLPDLCVLLTAFPDLCIHVTVFPERQIYSTHAQSSRAFCSFRFCGPATTVDVPTVPPPQRRVVREEGQAVAETGLIMSTLALYPAQVDLLAPHPDSPQSAALSGPPGTGKTVVLVLKGLQWLRQGRTVHVVSGDGGSRSISFLIEASLRAEAQRQGTAAGPPASASGGAVQHHRLDYISRVGAAVDELASLVEDGQLFVIMDESFSWPHRLVCV